MKYPMTEIFYSIQGEGIHAGIPTVFIRMAGCNYHCTWCDTEFPVNFKMDEKQIAKEVNEQMNSDTANICITGGEPLMHDLVPLFKELRRKVDFGTIEIESNGSFPDTHDEITKWAWLTVSPKKPNGDPVEDWEGIADALKLVYQGQDLSRFGCTGEVYFLQPLMIEDDEEATRKNTELTVEAVKRSSGWKLSLQTQKWLNIR